MAVDPELLELLRCPESGGELLYIRPADGDAFLFCPTSRLRFPIEAGDLPVLLLEEAERLDDVAAAALVADHGD